MNVNAWNLEAALLINSEDFEAAPGRSVIMKATEIHVFARQLRNAHGDKAIAEAAQKATSFESAGNIEQARIWRRVEAALKQMQGPRES
ncbi:MAG: hypothetical protein RLZ98_181 [Pseudomonadota bacterium]